MKKINGAAENPDPRVPHRNEVGEMIPTEIGEMIPIEIGEMIPIEIGEIIPTVRYRI